MEQMCFELDCGATLQIMSIGERYQTIEVIDDKSARKVGKLHNTIWGALDEVRKFELTAYERNTLEEIRDSLASTNAKITEYFELHSEYLAAL
ncbi:MULTISPECIES: hypothetical protein [Rodentibacter]|uniref:hypothetical protein n=1 Tax=Rodentibacter TaxID=1960084 RepID=UPI001CFD4031|nr:hypothetical protein [Rodentibacter sp. JRC1]GJI55874.1 hypothetical protein HEMROJRC1_09860 [Rodentibacter sp. JRC1]